MSKSTSYTFHSQQPSKHRHSTKTTHQSISVFQVGSASAALHPSTYPFKMRRMRGTWGRLWFLHTDKAGRMNRCVASLFADLDGQAVWSNKLRRQSDQGHSRTDQGHSRTDQAQRTEHKQLSYTTHLPLIHHTLSLCAFTPIDTSA